MNPSTVPMSRVFQLPRCNVSYALNLKETGTPTAQTLVRGHTGKDTKLDRDKAHIKTEHNGGGCALQFQLKCHKGVNWCQYYFA